MTAEKTKGSPVNWEVYAKSLEETNRRNLDGWQKTIEQLDACVQTLETQSREIDESLTQWKKLVEFLLIAFEISNQKPKRSVSIRVGRPRKDADGFDWLADHEAALRGYLAAHPARKGTDKEVLTWRFAEAFKSYGMRGSRATDPEFQKKLKVVINRLSSLRTARRHQS